MENYSIDLNNIHNLEGQEVPFGGKFIFMDCETANCSQDIVSIGAIVVDNYKIEKVIYGLIKPIGAFTQSTIKVHHITPDMVKDSPDFKGFWEEKFKFFNEEYAFVVHSKSADLNYLGKSFNYYKMTVPPICNCYDTKNIGQELFNKGSREELCKLLDIQSADEHNALSDACDCLNIFCRLFEKDESIMSNRRETYDLRKPKRKEVIDDYVDYKEHHRHLTREEVRNIVANDVPDMDFVGKKVVVTGTFRNFPERNELEREICERGGKCIHAVSAKVDYLIIGTLTDKNKKPENARKLNIKIIDEQTLYKMLENNDAVEVTNGEN